MRRGITTQQSVHFAMERTIEAPFNTNEVLYVKDLEGLKRKVAALQRDGPGKLRIFADFDYTLTRRVLDGAKCDNSFKVLENVNPFLSHSLKSFPLASSS